MPKVLIGIPCPVEGGFRPFDVALHKLCARYPKGEIEVFHAMSGVVPAARNRIVREGIKVRADYIWMLDDDQPFDPGEGTRGGDLELLLARNVDAVIPLSCRRGSPFFPLIYDTVDGDGENKWRARQHYMRDHEQGLIKVAGAGLAGLLMKTAIYQQLGSDGWFEFVHPPDNFDDYAEDFPFYRKLEAAGVQLYCDLDVHFGHAFTSVVYLLKQQGKWCTVMADTEPFVAFPSVKHPLAFDAPSERKQRVS